jgi:hypothetical protein
VDKISKDLNPKMTFPLTKLIHGIVTQTFLSAGSRYFPVACSGTAVWKVARTRTLESLRHWLESITTETNALT